MVKKVLLIILLFITFPELSLADGEILVVQSIRVSPYEDALHGFLSVSNPETKRLILSELKTSDLTREIENTIPSLIVAIGHDALESVKEIRDTPVIYLMVLSPQFILTHDDNFYGVSMNISPERQLEIFLKVIPDLNNIGLIYNPRNTDELAKKAVETAEKNGIRLITWEASRASDVPNMIKEMAGKIKAFWMLPDTTLMTPETIDLLLITSMERNIPIFTFSDKYVEIGALMSVAVDPYDMGRQGGELAQKLISGDIEGDGKRIFADKEVITLNVKIAQKLGINLNRELNLDARVIK
ncbi:ABC transporter substrate-binding protein [Thermodesulfobacteriota bacterium]